MSGGERVPERLFTGGDVGLVSDRFDDNRAGDVTVLTITVVDDAGEAAWRLVSVPVPTPRLMRVMLGLPSRCRMPFSASQTMPSSAAASG